MQNINKNIFLSNNRAEAERGALALYVENGGTVPVITFRVRHGGWAYAFKADWRAARRRSDDAFPLYMAVEKQWGEG